MRIWIRMIAALAAIALLGWLLVHIFGFAMGVLKAYTGDSGEQDPMFAEEAEWIEPTPLPMETADATVYEDNSANWDTSVQTPVDQTIEELQQEAQEAAG